MTEKDINAINMLHTLVNAYPDADLEITVRGLRGSVLLLPGQHLGQATFDVDVPPQSLWLAGVRMYEDANKIYLDASALPPPRRLEL